MSAKVDPNEETIQMGVRIPKSLADALDAESARLEAQLPGHRFTRSDVARAVLTRALLLQAPVVDPTPAVANPTPPKAEAPAAAPPPKPAHKAPAKPASQLPLPPTLEQAVIAELKAVEKPAETGGELEMDLATVVRALEAQGHQREAIHTELKRLGTEGVDVLKLEPDSGGGNELKEDRAIVPRRMGDGVPFLKARWNKRPVDPPTARTYTDEQLLARLKAFQEKTGQTERDVADGAGIGKDTLNRWTNGKTKNGLKTRDKAKLITYLDAQEGIA